MKKSYLLFTIVVIASMVLAACAAPTAAPTKAPVVEPTKAPVVEPTKAPEPTAAPVEPTAVPEPAGSIRIWADEQRAPVLNELAAKFKETYNMELVVENVSTIRDSFITAAPAGEGPDIIIVPHDQAAQLVASGLVAPLDLGEKTKDFSEAALKAFTYDGKLYGMPYATENLGFFYNKDLVTTVPTTWQEVYDISKQLIADGKVKYGMVLAGTSYDAYPWMTSQGGYVFGRNAAGDYDPMDLGIGKEGMIKFATMAKKWVDDKVLSDNLDNTTAKSMFVNGDVAFLMNGPWELNNLRTAKTPYAIAAFPDGGVPFMGVQGFLVNSFSKNVLLAQTFLTEFIATEETMLALEKADPRVPAYLPALAKLDDPDLVKIAEAGANAQPMPAIPEMGKVWTAWGDALTFVFKGEKTPEEAYTFAATTIAEAIAANTKGMVNVPGSWQAKGTAGACEDWKPECPASALAEKDGKYVGTFTIPAGDYEVKVALDGGWAVNYGVDGKADGDNYKFTVAKDGEVTFTFDPATKLLDIKLP
jgi:maltose/maltodextrin transport system substrate-binding protein/arabinogalactan oligomer/maltooligosaccharide transport system substrate-binding protein